MNSQRQRYSVRYPIRERQHCTRTDGVGQLNSTRSQFATLLYTPNSKPPLASTIWPADDRRCRAIRSAEPASNRRRREIRQRGERVSASFHLTQAAFGATRSSRRSIDGGDGACAQSLDSRAPECRRERAPRRSARR